MHEGTARMGGPMLSLAPLLFAALLSGASNAPLPASVTLDAPTRHVRTTSRSITKLLARGYQRSPTLAAIITKLQHSDVFVYIEDVPRLPGALEGRLMMLPRAHEARYVRIQIALRGAPEDTIALLGHELQHALEVAEAPSVSDQAGLERLYARIGVSGGSHQYDTVAAQETGRTVRRELAASRAQDLRGEEPAQRAGPLGRQHVEVDAADAALLELERRARSDQLGRQLAEIRLVADERHARLAHVPGDLLDHRRRRAGRRQRVGGHHRRL